MECIDGKSEFRDSYIYSVRNIISARAQFILNFKIQKIIL